MHFFAQAACPALAPFAPHFESLIHPVMLSSLGAAQLVSPTKQNITASAAIFFTTTSDVGALEPLRWYNPSLAMRHVAPFLSTECHSVIWLQKNANGGRSFAFFRLRLSSQAAGRWAIAASDSRVGAKTALSLTADSAARVKAASEISMSRTAISKNAAWLMRFSAIHHSQTIT